MEQGLISFAWLAYGIVAAIVAGFCYIASIGFMPDGMKEKAWRKAVFCVLLGILWPLIPVAIAIAKMRNG